VSYPPLTPGTWAALSPPSASPGVLTPRLDAALQDAVRRVPQTPRGGYVSADLTTHGAQVTAGQRLSARWAVGGWIGMTGGATEAGVRLTGHW
jgi:hypothetical protein